MAGVRPSIEQPAVLRPRQRRGHDPPAAGGGEARREEVPLRLQLQRLRQPRRECPFSEDDPVAEPISPYAATKRAGELLCYTFWHLYKLPVFCLRFFTVYGPRQRPDLAIHKFTRLISRGQPVPLFGDGSTSRDYTYVDDIVAGIVASLDKCDRYRIYNLGGSDPVSLAKLVEELEKAIGRPGDHRPAARRSPATSSGPTPT